jgi:putative ABC transport system permease protein
MFKNYFKTALRNLRRNKIYSAINISGIAIGLAAFWLIMLYVSDELNYDRSFSNADRICRVAQHASWPGGSMNIVPTSAPFVPAFKTTFPEVEDAARINIEGGGVMKYAGKIFNQNDIFFADNSLLKLFDYHFLYGNAADALTQPQSIVITQTLAGKIFGDASKAVNQTILFGTDNYPNKVTGVIADLPKNSHLQFSGIRSFGDALNNDTWNNTYLYTYLLLKKGTDIKAFQNKITGFEKKLAKQLNYTEYHIELQPLTSIHLHSNLDYELSANGSISRIYLFIVIALLVLLIALINYMNLSTARSATRVKEIGIRKVIGSSRKHLVGLFISEAILVTLIASAIACFLVQLSLPFFNQLSGKELNIWYFGIANSIAMVIVFAFIVGIISGSYPAFFLSKFKTIPSLKGQLGNTHSSIIFRKSLVVFQFVIAVFLISSSFIIFKQLQYVSQKDLGFNKEQVLTFHIDDTHVRSEIPALKHALLQNPLIEAVAIAGNPIGNNDLNTNGFLFEKNGAMPTSSQLANKLYIDEEFLNTTDIHLLQGRNFSKDMPTDKDGAVIINETLMKTLGYTNAIGKKMQYFTPDNKTLYKIIVGVVKDFHAYSLQHTIEPMVMMMPPNDKEQDNLYVKVAKGKAAQGIAYLKNTYQKFDSNNTSDFHFLDENFAKQYAAEQKQGTLSFAFTVLAFIIACLGLVGLVIFATAQRTKEIGIRKVLGASVTSVTVLLSKDFAKLVAIATIIGVPIAWFAMNKWLQDFAYRISIEWWMFLLSGCTAILIALITVSFQSIKAAIANPVKSLRTE